MIHRPLVLAAVESLSAIFNEGQVADRAIERTLRRNKRLGSRDRRFIAETVYEIVRWWRKLNWVLELEGKDFEQIVKLHVALNTAEQLPAWFEWDDNKVASLKARWASIASPAAIENSLPDWLQQQGEKELGAAWPATIRALNKTAPVFLRANTLKMQRPEVLKSLANEEIAADPLPDSEIGLVLRQRKNVFSSKAFLNGGFEVQDGGSQKIAPLLRAQPGEKVIDACAGAGGKSLHLAAMMKNQGEILSLDIYQNKLDELRVRAKRAGVKIIKTKLVDDMLLEAQRESADRVLLDVPCSGSGTWRRNPGQRWKMTPEEFAQLHLLQAEILRRYSSMVRPGGTLVYATCSVWPSENQVQVEKFLSEAPGLFTPEEEVQVSPLDSAYDGFYAIRLIRKQ